MGYFMSSFYANTPMEAIALNTIYRLQRRTDSFEPFKLKFMDLPVTGGDCN